MGSRLHRDSPDAPDPLWCKPVKPEPLPRCIYASVSAVGLAVAAGCGPQTATIGPTPAEPPRVAAPVGRPAFAAPAFVDVARQAGIAYRWSIPGKRPLNILQTIGNGCAFLDFDNDGNLDILLVGPKLALYKGDGHGHFADVTHEAGLDRLHGHFLGCAVGDYDNDGYDDIYISAYRGGVLLHNEAAASPHPRPLSKKRDSGSGAGGATPVPPSGGRGATTRQFRDVTRACGIAPQPWGTSCAWADVDGDGWLDLFIGNYVRFGPTSGPQLCSSQGGVMTGCGPGSYGPERGTLYRNLGGGRFMDVTHSWGVDAAHGKVLGVAAAPFGDVRRLALAVADDQVPSDLLELGGGRVRNLGLASGMAYGPYSTSYGGMGVDWGDYDNDGRLDLVVATYENERKCLFRNTGGTFQVLDSVRYGLEWCEPYVAFGVKWLDYDNDGWLDLIFSNGHTLDNAPQAEPFGARPSYRQPIVLFHNEGGARFRDASTRLVGRTANPIVGRGLAIGDFDNDGRIDVLVADAEGRPLLLHNVATDAGHWLLVRLVGRRCNRDGYGALVIVEASDKRLVRHCHADGSYLASSDKRVHFGLGAATHVDRLTVEWPDGRTDTYTDLPVNTILRVVEGGQHPQHDLPAGPSSRVARGG